ncbi:efflux transporter outer membrane subunit [Noviherbaspirillum sp. DKR-6]|uniref:Efflux transporter outer membrane subunit n=2 Tax=Noviherbaspirillum pedocola TaxID=2801341 RepID=A0A934T2L0_9BURK|nr:efflux transporter outer membrane subunit [Noviherbaspirillum pedocola]
MRIVFSAWLTTLLAACSAVGPDYHGAPATSTPAAFTRAFDESPAAPLATWWAALGDHELDTLVARALQSSPTLPSVRARLLRARAALQATRANAAPNVSASALYAHARLPSLPLGGGNSGGGSSPSSLNLYNLGFDASWEIDLFGGQRRAAESAQAALGAAEAQLADAQVSLSAEVAQAYVNLRATQARLALAAAAIQRQTRVLQLTEQREAGGTASKLDVARLRNQLEATRADVAPLEAQRDAYSDALAFLVGAMPGTLDAELAQVTPLPLPPAQVAVGDPAALLQRRPDIRAAERVLAARSAAIGQAEASRFPRLSFLGLIGIGGTTPGSLSQLDDFTVIAAPQLRWSFLDFGRGAARVKSAEADRDEAEAQYRVAVLGALRDAEDALSRYSKRRVAVATAARAKGAADEAAMLMRARLRAGTANLIEMLDAERQQIAAEQNLLAAEAGLTGDFVSLQKALGLGWSQEAGPRS